MGYLSRLECYLIIDSQFAQPFCITLTPYRFYTVQHSERPTAWQSGRSYGMVLASMRAWISIGQSALHPWCFPQHKFPWDPKLKTCLLNIYHNLHSLARIAKLSSHTQNTEGKPRKHLVQGSFMEFSAGLPATYPMPHVMHRLDVLRDVVMYHADDTPRSITTTQKPESGIG